MSKSRVENIKEILELIFEGEYVSKTEELPQDVSEAVDSVDDWYLNNRSYDWHVRKYDEEFEEVRTALNQYTVDTNDEYRYALVGECVDFIISLAACRRFDDFKRDDILAGVRTGFIKKTIKEHDIKVDEVMKCLYNKSVELFVGINTYLLCREGYRDNKMCKIVHTLYNSMDLANPDKTDKIVKEIRRMWYAMNYNV